MVELIDTRMPLLLNQIDTIYPKNTPVFFSILLGEAPAVGGERVASLALRLVLFALLCSSLFDFWLCSWGGEGRGGQMEESGDLHGGL